MTYRLFLDDVREPPRDGEDWLVARSMQEAVNAIKLLGMPSFISFDHDLGDKVPTGQDFAKWVVEQDLDNHHPWPAGFSFRVHSANPPGRENIESLMNCYLRTKG